MTVIVAKASDNVTLIEITAVGLWLEKALGFMSCFITCVVMSARRHTHKFCAYRCTPETADLNESFYLFIKTHTVKNGVTDAAFTNATPIARVTILL